MEQSFRQAMTISDGSLAIFASSGITVALLVMSVASVVLPFVIPKRKTSSA